MWLLCARSGQLEVTQTYANHSQKGFKMLPPLRAPITPFRLPVPPPACPCEVPWYPLSPCGPSKDGHTKGNTLSGSILLWKVKSERPFIYCAHTAPNVVCKPQEGRWINTAALLCALCRWINGWTAIWKIRSSCPGNIGCGISMKSWCSIELSAKARNLASWSEKNHQFEASSFFYFQQGQSSCACLSKQQIMMYHGKLQLYWLASSFHFNLSHGTHLSFPKTSGGISHLYFCQRQLFIPLSKHTKMI